MDYGDLYGGLNALDVVRAVRTADGTYSHMVVDSETVPVSDTPTIIAMMFAALYPTPTLISPAAGATGVALGPTLVSREGVSRVYTVGTRATSTQTGVGLNSDLIFNNASDDDVPLNVTTGVFTLKAGVEYELVGCPNLSDFTAPNTGFAKFAWVFAATNVQLPNGSAGYIVPLRDTSGKSIQPTCVATYRPTVDTDVKLRVFENGDGTCSLLTGSSWARASVTTQRYLDYTIGNHEFQVRRADNQVLVFESGVGAGLSTVVTPDLDEATEYQVRVRHSDNILPTWTAWSAWQNFTTA